MSHDSKPAPPRPMESLAGLLPSIELDPVAQKQFKLTALQLYKMVRDRDAEGKDELHTYGGVDGIQSVLRSSTTDGISSDPHEIELRKRAFGINVLPDHPPRAFLLHLFDALNDTTMIILIVAAIVSLLVGLFVITEDNGWLEGAAIMLAVIVVSSVASIQNWQKDREFYAMNKVKEDSELTIRRDGEVMEISIFDLVVGDVIKISKGLDIPCDGLFLQGFGVEVNESAMTGEPLGIKKNADKPFLLKGTDVLQGNGWMMCTAVGLCTQHGQLMSLLSEPGERETPLQQKLTSLATAIGKIGTAVAVITFLLMALSWAGHYAFDASKNFTSKSMQEMLRFFVVAVTIVVVAVPEGLPLAVTISLAFSMKKMLRDNNLVKRLEASEIMGGATTICSDKTGTLTENRMTVVKGFFCGIYFDEIPDPSMIPTEGFDLLINAISIDSDADITIPSDPTLRTVFHGNPTEGALLYLLNKSWGRDYRTIRDSTLSNVVFKVNFDSNRKRSCTLVDLGNGTTRMYMKGAPEIVLYHHCLYYINENGQTAELDDQKVNEMSDMINNLASQGLRTVAVAYKDIDGSYDWETEILNLEKNLTFVGVVGIKDPLRPEVPNAVRKCQRAGIKVRMVTGDNVHTALFIAKECGIYQGGLVMEGSEFRRLTPSQQRRVVKKLDVLARSLPDDKYILVTRLKELNEVVAVTGDGTNDAPALNAAHVGLAMNIAGTDVAKRAAKIVILDDNFASIVNSVKWGRSVFENIQKFLQFQLTINYVALGITFLTKAAQREEFPLTPVQLLWVNLIMDSFAALALATEPPSEELLQRAPRSKNDPLITGRMYKNILVQGTLQIIILMFLVFVGHRLFSEEFESRAHYTVVFNTFVMLQVFNIFNSRKLFDHCNMFEGIFKGFVFITVVLIIIIGQIIIVNFGGSVTSTVQISFVQWLGCILIGSFSIPFGYLTMFLPCGKVVETSEFKSLSGETELENMSNDEYDDLQLEMRNEP